MDRSTYRTVDANVEIVLGSFVVNSTNQPQPQEAECAVSVLRERSTRTDNSSKKVDNDVIPMVVTYKHYSGDTCSMAIDAEDYPSFTFLLIPAIF